MNPVTPIQAVFDRINYERRNASGSGNEFKLDTITHLLEKLGNPHQNLPVIHIAGTKGKGSTAQLISAIGSRMGWKTATYSSPHFVRYTERFVVNGVEVTENRLNQVLARILEAVNELDQEIESGLDLPPATFFDISTAAAFLLFREENVDLVALEVGLGGRLDSTNVCQPLVSVITTISLDHMKQLGNTLPEIAAEKAAIIKPSTAVICGAQEPEIAALIQQKADSQDADFFQYGVAFDAANLQTTTDGVEFDYLDRSSQRCIEKIRLNLLGRHQGVNASVAIRAVAEFAKRSTSKTDTQPVVSNKSIADHRFETAVRTALSEISLRGRLEILSKQPLVIADMAHNAVSIAAMISTLADFPATGKRQAIFSCSKDKDHAELLRQLATHFDRIILTRFRNNPRARSTQELLSTAQTLSETKPGVQWLVMQDSEIALNRALDDSAEYPLTCICGSIFLVGELIDSPLFPNRITQSNNARGSDSSPLRSDSLPQETLEGKFLCGVDDNHPAV